MTVSLDANNSIEKDVGVRPFTFDVELQSCYKEPDGTPHVVGIASDDMEDRTGDRMSDKAVTGMARQCNRHDLPLLDNHRATFGFGHTHSAQARRVPVTTKDGKQKVKTELVVDFALDTRFAQSDVLFSEVQSKKSKKQLSIGGFLNTSNPKAVRFEENEKGRTVRVIEDIELEHIAATRPNMAAVPRTKFVDAIVKDVFGDEDGHKSPPLSERSGRFHRTQELEAEPTPSQDAQENPMTTETNVDPKAAATPTPAATPAATATLDPKEMEEATKAAKMLAQIGKVFADSATPADILPEEITDLVSAAEKAVKVTMTEKGLDTVKRVHSALTRLLAQEGVAGADPAVEITPEAKTVAIDDVKMAEALAPILEGQKQLAKVFETALVNLTTELGKGLEGLGQGFKDFVKDEIGKVKDEVQNVNKEADTRLDRLEKASGTSKRLTGSEGGVATGDPRPAIEKNDSRALRKPDQKNPWRGLFDAGLTAQQRRQVAGR